MAFIRAFINVLKTPVPLPKFMVTPIHIPILSEPISLPPLFGKKKRAVRRPPTRRHTNKPKAKAVPTASPSSLGFSLEGVLSAGQTTLFSVSGQDIKTNADTWIFGELRVGMKVKVKGTYINGDERLCTSIIVCR